MSWSSLAWLALVVACGAEAHTTPRADSARQLGTLEGYVLDSETNAPLAGAAIDTTYRHQEGKSALTDEHGHYGLEWPVGVVEILAGVGTATSSISSVEVVDGRATAFDIRIDHAALVTSLRANPPLNCPGSPPGAVIEGHTTSQRDVDEIASEVLKRFAADVATMPGHGMRFGDPVRIQLEIEGHRRLSDAALPRDSSRHLVGMSRGQLQDEADRTKTEITFIGFSDIYSDGTCGIVDVGADFLAPTRDRRGKRCCCTATDVYEKRERRWVFVRRAHEVCA